MARMPLADLFLDTFPYNAGTVASDAIRMGLPLVTRVGEAFASRMAARLLYAIGADDGITDSACNYVSKAVDLATYGEYYGRYKSRFNPAVWARSIGDTAAFTGRFEATLQRVCRRPDVTVSAPDVG
jgi:predicted O-linked N-acetylglucosamine transferase (SPINDLY family)